MHGIFGRHSTSQIVKEGQPSRGLHLFPALVAKIVPPSALGMMDHEKTTDISEAPPTVAPVSQRRLNVIIVGLWICLFLSAMDTTVVTTALIKISSDFDALEKSTWLFTAYLLTYNCKLIHWLPVPY